MPKSNIDKLILHPSILGAVRERMGAEDGNDTSKDEEINKMEPRVIIRAWSGWEIGDEAWADSFIRLIEIVFDMKLPS